MPPKKNTREAIGKKLKPKVKSSVLGIKSKVVPKRFPNRKKLRKKKIKTPKELKPITPAIPIDATIISPLSVPFVGPAKPVPKKELEISPEQEKVLRKIGDITEAESRTKKGVIKVGDELIKTLFSIPNTILTDFDKLFIANDIMELLSKAGAVRASEIGVGGKNIPDIPKKDIAVFINIAKKNGLSGTLADNILSSSEKFGAGRIKKKKKKKTKKR